MTTPSKVTNDDINDAFRTDNVLKASDELLLQYLRVLCTERQQADFNQAVATNRCITINTLLTQRFMKRVDRATTRYTFAVIVLTVIATVAAVAQVVVAFWGMC